MATAREAVEFVVRGRDEGAEKVLKNLTQTAKLFHKSLELGGADTRLLNSMSRLGAGAVTLAKEFGSFATENALSQGIKNSNQQIDNFGQTVGNRVRDIHAFERGIDKLGKELTEVTPKLTGATAAVKAQTAATAESATAQAAATTELQKAEQNLAALIERKRQLKIQDQQLAKTAPASLANAENLRQIQEGINSTERFIARRKELAGIAKNNETARKAEQEADQTAQSQAQATLDKQVAKLKTLGDRQQVLINKERELNQAQKNGAKNEKTRVNNAAKLKDIDAEIRAQKELIANSKVLVATATTDTNKRAAATKAATKALDEQNLELGKARTALRALTAERKRLNTEAKEGGFRKDDKSRADIREELRLLDELETQYKQGIQRRQQLAATTKAAHDAELAKLNGLIATEKKYQETQRAIIENQKKLVTDKNAANVQLDKDRAKLQESIRTTRDLVRAKRELNTQGIIQAQQTKATARGHREATGAVRQHARAQTALQLAMNKFYGNNRIQLSILQRMRTEVHGLLLQTAGVFAIYRGLQGVVEATKTIQKAENRLRSVVGDDAQLIGAELDFIRRNAKRLGIEFGILSNEYTKFSIATKNTNLEGANTRKIFTSVAEAARVNGADNEALSGTFLALTQIVSKGTVTMEELKRQLGDRLPGAVHIMADALGVTTAELFKMVEAGEVTSDSLVKFADELDDRFGPALGKALRSTQTQIGRLQHELFQIQLRIAQSGFLESFNDLLGTLTETLGSPRFQSFADRMGGLMATLADGIGWVIERWAAFISLFTGFAITRVLPIIGVLISKVFSLGAAIFGLNGIIGPTIPRMERMRRGFVAMRIEMVATAGAAGKMAVAFRALKVLWFAVTPLLTALSVAIVGFATYFTTGSTEANEFLQDHTNLLDYVVNAWDAAAGNVEKYINSLEKLNVPLAQANYDAAKIAAEEAKTATRRRVAVNRDEDGNTKVYDNFGGLSYVQKPQIGDDGNSKFEEARDSAIRAFESKVDGKDVPDPKFLEGTGNFDNLNNFMAGVSALEAEITRLASVHGITGTTIGTGSREDVENLRKSLEYNKQLNKEFKDRIEARRADLLLQSAQAKADRNLPEIARIAKELSSTETQLHSLKGSLDSSDTLTSLDAQNPYKSKDVALQKKLDAVNDTADEAIAEIREDIAKHAISNATLRADAESKGETYNNQFAEKDYQALLDNIGEINKTRDDTLAAIIRKANEKEGGTEKDPGKVLQDAAKDLINALDSTQKQYDLTVPTVAFGEHKSDPGLAALRDTFAELSKTDIPAAIQAVLDYYGALEKTPENLKIIEQWKQIQLEQQAALDKSNEIRVSWSQGEGILDGGFNSGIETLAQELYETEKLFRALEEAARSFFSSFFLGIGKAIQEQLSFNAAKAVIGFIGGPVGIFHEGGLVGASSGTSRNIPPIFKYHTGGLAGLAPNEVPAILERNEEVLRRDDPRHILNGGKGKAGDGSSPPQSVNVFNYMNFAQAFQAFLNSPEGEGIKNMLNNNGMEG